MNEQEITVDVVEDDAGDPYEAAGYGALEPLAQRWLDGDR